MPDASARSTAIAIKALSQRGDPLKPYQVEDVAHALDALAVEVIEESEVWKPLAEGELSTTAKTTRISLHRHGHTVCLGFVFDSLTEAEETSLKWRDQIRDGGEITWSFHRATPIRLS